MSALLTPVGNIQRRHWLCDVNRDACADGNSGQPQPMAARRRLLQARTAKSGGHDTAPVHPSTRTAPTRYNVDSPRGTCPPPVPDPYSQAHRLQLVGNRTLIKATGAPGKARDATAENKWAGTPVHVKCLPRTRTVPAQYPSSTRHVPAHYPSSTRSVHAQHLGNVVRLQVCNHNCG